MKKNRLLYNNSFIVVAILVFLSIEVSCSHETDFDRQFELAERLIEEQPDSSLSILENIEESKLRGRRSKARYALLKSIALDKNYIDTTTFDVLQPAIDYYSENGTYDEKLKTKYYQGIIYENAGEDDAAMQSFLEGLEIKGLLRDSLSLARLYVAQAILFYKQYRISEFSENNLLAADLFGKLGRVSEQLKCYARALDGECRLMNKEKADSIADICRSIKTEDKSSNIKALRSLLIYGSSLGKDEDIKRTIDSIQALGVTKDLKMDLARAYAKIGEVSTGLKYLNEVWISPDNILDSLTYWSVKTNILERMGEDRNALEAYRHYSRVLEKYHDSLFSNELLFSEKKHEMEMENMARLRKRDNTIIWILVAAGGLLIITVLIYYRYRMNKAGRELAENNAEKLQLEGEKQRLLAEKLESERAQLSLEAENLHLQIAQLEGEKERLEGLLDGQASLSGEARELIRDRISMLNGLFAEALTDQVAYGKEFKTYILKIRKDKKGFQESLVKVLATTHPDFIASLQEHGLTEREIEYCCLYAIGLRGKEIGAYLDLARHYNISSDIRRKLGLDPNDGNLGPYLRNLLTKRK